MNAGSDFNRPPDDEANDPLLAALRQRLGEGFGQEPPPELWAGIQQRLPAPAPRPWRLRVQRRLPLLAVLASLLLLVVVATRRAGPLPAGGLATQQLPDSPAPGVATRAVLPTTSRPATSLAATTPARRPVLSGRVARSPGAAPTSTPLVAKEPRATTSTALSAPRAASTLGLGHAVGLAPGRRQHFQLPQRAWLAAGPARRQPAATRSPQAADLPGNAHLAVAPATRQAAGAARLTSGLTALRRARPAARRALAAPASTTRTLPGAPASTRPVAASQPNPALATIAPQAGQLRATGKPASHSHQSGLGTAGARQHLGNSDQHVASLTPLRPGPAPARPVSIAPQARPGAVATVPAAIATLAGRHPALPRVVAGLPPVLAAAPDTTRPWVLPVRRWSVLAVAGPTLSYRTLGPAAAGLAPSPTPISTPGTSFTTTPSISTLERPAAGLGAQVQVRRVLSGRWALGLGLGYQEYATRLALRVVSYNPTYPANIAFDTVRVVHQRDTYRLLTLPVQLSYTLGPPRRHLALGVLAGFEPGLYVGGRTTENSTCNCQQQPFTSATGSPYRAFNLAFSLGLDVRYRLGGPAGRWQLLVQPTGRYVATPFVRSTALGYARRQPYSLGLLTGFSWDLR